ncbi:phage tail protein [Sphingobium boeckii]|uniref:Tip attachment protein J domain-containing protein n=1 Tax=Sphingobium boeckii TaxID=1082345 RepID=A0A7W9AI26_9SPHN|nr:phage tail protein [Sphingobium boeckii]MBB5685816.1 hypothetical protein [Sphingobium boeckii]
MGKRGDGWTRAKEDLFFALLAETCNVSAALRGAEMSSGSAYRRRLKCAAFRARWAEAVREGYAVFEDFQLADYGNRIPSLTFEIEADDGAVTLSAIASALSDGTVSGGTLALGGYAASGDSVRGAIEALADAAGLSLADDGLALMLTNRGAAEASVPRGDWLPDAESERGAALTIPDALALAYYEPARDYQAGLQRATRGGAGRKTERVELPVAIRPGQAKAMAEAKLARDWAARERRRIGLSWRWMTMRPGAVITLEGEAGLWRIAEWALEGMAVKLSLVRVRGGSDGAMPEAEPGRGVGSLDAPHGPTILHLLDLPDPGEPPATAPRLYAAAAGASAGWRRAAMALSLDEGASWSAIGNSAPAAVIGTAMGALQHGSPHLFDDIGAVDIALAHDGMTLAEADDARLIAGANLALLGDELIQFGRAEPLGEARYRLSRLLRGRRGTETAMSSHMSGERFVLIEADALVPIDFPPSSLGGVARLMATGLGDGAPVIAMTTGIGASVRPPSPVGVTIAPHPDGGFALGWTRRSRQGWRWVDGVDAPIGEEREAYALRIVTGHGTIRIAETGAPGFHYDAAMIAEDGGTGDSIALSITQTGALAVSLPANATFSLI